MNANSRHALLVVADEAMRRLCSETLAETGFAVADSIGNGAAAVASARERLPDVILLSQQLNDVPAIEAVRWMRAIAGLTATPVIILGGNAAAAPDSVTVLSRSVTATQLRKTLAEVLPGNHRQLAS
jgi:DNA-binding response OmpR family regulator